MSCSEHDSIKDISIRTGLLSVICGLHRCAWFTAYSRVAFVRRVAKFIAIGR